MRKENFEKLVAEAIDSLPDKFLRKLENVDVLVEPAPSPATLSELRMSNEDVLLGLYRGIPLDSRGTGYGCALPDTITIYKKPVERLCGGEELKIKEKIREVLIHEIGHHFGMEEDELSF